MQIATNSGLSGAGTIASPLAVSFGGNGSASTAARSDHSHPPLLGEGRDNPATSCAALLTARPGLASNVYWIKPSTAAVPFRAYCDMMTDGGGWTLVWSNLRGRRGKPVTDLQWTAALRTAPLYAGDVSADLESFMVYTGLMHWPSLAPHSLLRYSWANDYGSPIDQSYKCTFGFTGANYILGLTGCTQLVGNVVPGLFSYHNNRPFSAYDRDNDAHPDLNCAAYHAGTPFWYHSCWSGSINGGGETSGGAYSNGAHWSGSTGDWGLDNGTGAGNGWMFVK